MALATLSIDLVAQLASLQQGMDKAGRLAEKTAAQIEGRFAAMESAAASVGRALGAAISVAGITAFVKATVDGLDRLNDLSDATGASIENLSALEDIAARTGTSMDTVGDAVIKLNKALADAKPGSDQAAALKAIGLSAAELKELDPAEALRRVAVALAGFADDGNKARLVQELFGKSLREVAPLLGDLARGGELQAKVTAEQAKQAEKFNQELASLAKNATDAAREIAGPLVASLNSFFAAAKKNERGVVGAIADTFQADWLRARLQATTEQLTDAFAQYQQDLKTVKDGGFYARAFAAERISEYQQLQAAAEGYRKELDALLYSGSRRPANEGGGKLRVESLPDLTKPPPSVVPKAVEPFVVKLDDTTAAALKLLENTDTQKIAELRLQLQALIEMRGDTGGGAVDEAILQIEEALSKLTPEGKAAADAAERLKAILEQTYSTKLDGVLRDVELLNAAFERGELSAEKWTEGIRAVTARLPVETDKPLAEISESAREAARNIQDALGDTMLQTLKGSTSNLGDIWRDMLLRMAAEASAAKLGQLLLGDFAKTGTVGGWFGDLASWFGGARASGGPVAPGRAYLVGERGPEWLVPRTAGTVLPSGSQPVQPGNQITYAPTFNLQGAVSAAQVEGMLIRERSRFARMLANV